MKNRTAICIALVISMAAPSLALAQGRGDRGDRGRNDQAQRGDREDRRDNADRGVRRHGPPAWANNRHDRYPDGGRRWNRGDRLPPEYRDRQYVINDWRGHQLSAPPRGHQWVQSGSDYLLVAVATGLIAQLLANR